MAETARLWAIRVGEPAFDDWNGFTAWLEADPAHLSAYNSALDTVTWAQRVLANEAQAANDDGGFVEHLSGGRRWALGGAIAACLALAGTWLAFGQYGTQTVMVPAGQHRTLALADGSHVVVNGGSKLLIDRKSRRQVELARGEALFEIRHDSANPFVVTVGGAQLVDAGTVFNVVSGKGALDVEVAKGAVVYRRGEQQIRLDAGMALTRASDDATPVVSQADPGAVGGWQNGLLQYDDALLTKVADDLSRNLGIPVVAGDGAERMHFTGTLVISGTRADVFKRAEALMGVRFEPQGDGWRFTPAHDARR